MGRYKSRRFVPGERLAFRVFGDVRRRHTMYALPLWERENAPPEEIVFETPESALEHKARLMEADLAEWERWCGFDRSQR
jgi:hypothetical protein